MNVKEYKSRVIAFLKSGGATDDQWDEVATCVLHASENDDSVPCIDAVLESLTVQPALAEPEKEWRLLAINRTLHADGEVASETQADEWMSKWPDTWRKQWRTKAGEWRDVETVG